MLPYVQSIVWIGHACHADTQGLRAALFGRTLFYQGNGPKSCQRVIRGGSWNNTPHTMRASNRDRNRPDNCNNNQEFRLVQSARANF